MFSELLRSGITKIELFEVFNAPKILIKIHSRRQTDGQTYPPTNVFTL